MARRRAVNPLVRIRESRSPKAERNAARAARRKLADQEVASRAAVAAESHSRHSGGCPSGNRKETGAPPGRAWTRSAPVELQVQTVERPSRRTNGPDRVPCSAHLGARRGSALATPFSNVATRYLDFRWVQGSARSHDSSCAPHRRHRHRRPPSSIASSVDISPPSGRSPSPAIPTFDAPDQVAPQPLRDRRGSVETMISSNPPRGPLLDRLERVGPADQPSTFLPPRVEQPERGLQRPVGRLAVGDVRNEEGELAGPVSARRRTASIRWGVEAVRFATIRTREPLLGLHGYSSAVA